MKSTRLLMLLLLLSAIFAGSSFAQKFSPEEIVAKHLDSIGTKEKRDSIKNQILSGNVQFTLTGAATPVTGRFVIASAGEKNLWGMNLNSNDYPMDRFGYDGKDVQVGFAKPGSRSILGFFIYSYRELLKEGFLGGTLESSWALMNTAAKNPKLSYEGKKKINGTEALVLSYLPKSGSDLSVRMYFNASNFQHLRTEYNRSIAARQGATIDTSAGQGEDRYQLIEDFSDFKDVNGLTLPTTYKLSYSFFNGGTTQSTGKKSQEAEWKFTVTNFSYNQSLHDSSFNIGVQ